MGSSPLCTQEKSQNIQHSDDASFDNEMAKHSMILAKSMYNISGSQADEHKSHYSFLEILTSNILGQGLEIKQ